MSIRLLDEPTQLATPTISGLDLYYELHGCAPAQAKRRLVLIMGLNTSCFAWMRAVQHYGDPSRLTSVLVLDNRGVGYSDTPPSPRFYKTTELARDALDLLDALDWKSNLHIAGVSMGGMISQHIADIDPGRVSSLTLISTTAGRQPWQAPKLPSLKGLDMITRVALPPPLGPRNLDEAMNWVADVLFPPAWLEQESEIDGIKSNNRQRIVEGLIKRRNTGRKQEPAGALGQMAAALTHSFSAERCRLLGQNVAAVLVVTGDTDNLVNPAGSQFLHENIPESKLVVIPNAGHALPEQCFERLHILMEENFALAEERMADRQ